MSKYRNGLFYSREDEGSEDVLVGDGGTGQAMAEVAEASQETDELVSAVEDAVEGADQIEAVASTLENTIPEGGAEPATAEMAEVAVEGICRRLNVPYRRISTESFGRASSRKRATELAVESIADTAKKIWERILRVIKDIWEKVKDFFNKLFDANEKVRARAKDILSRANALKVEAKETKKIEVGSWVKKILLSGQKDVTFEVVALNSAGLGRMIIKASEMVDSVQASFKEMAKEGISEFIDRNKKLFEESAAEHRDTVGKKIGALYQEKTGITFQFVELIETVSGTIEGTEYEKMVREFKDDSIIITSSELPGGDVMKAEGRVDATSGIVSFKISKINVGVGVDADKVKSIPIWKKDEIVKMSSGIVNACGSIDKTRGNLKKFDDLVYDLRNDIKGMERELDVLSKKDDSESRDEMKAVRIKSHVYTGYSACVSTIVKEINSAAVSFAEGVCSMLELMMKEHGEAKESKAST